MSGKNIKNKALESSGGYNYFTADDPTGATSYSEPADHVAFARLERLGYTIVRDDAGNIVAAIHSGAERRHR